MRDRGVPCQRAASTGKRAPSAVWRVSHLSRVADCKLPCTRTSRDFERTALSCGSAADKPLRPNIYDGHRRLEISAHDIYLPKQCVHCQTVPFLSDPVSLLHDRLLPSLSSLKFHAAAAA